ncbi:MAG: hypothetical protein ACRECO_09110 [Xanthobacteraceae bacterium]
MRSLRAAGSRAYQGFDPSAITRGLGITATVLATAAIVLLAAFVAVAMGLT